MVPRLSSLSYTDPGPGTGTGLKYRDKLNDRRERISYMHGTAFVGGGGSSIVLVPFCLWGPVVCDVTLIWIIQVQALHGIYFIGVLRRGAY